MTRTEPGRSLLRPAAFSALAVAILVGLGLWQLQRRSEKHALIAAISARADAAPGPLPDPSEWPHLAPSGYEYRHVVVEGVFDEAERVLVFRPRGGGTTGVAEPGFLVLVPMRLASGAHVIVNRGFVPESALAALAPANPDAVRVTRLTGLMRAPEARNVFTPRDDLAAGRAFTRDPVAIAAHFGLQGAAPFSIDADPTPDPVGWPRPGTTVLQIPDNHLGYALTWFGLATAAAAIFFLYARAQGRGRS